MAFDIKDFNVNVARYNQTICLLLMMSWYLWFVQLITLKNNY